jgi:uncharacterized protein YxeA
VQAVEKKQGGDRFMKKIAVFMLAVLVSVSLCFAKTVKVKAYTKKDGTYVKAHERTSPDKTKTNNKSYKK